MIAVREDRNPPWRANSAWRTLSLIPFGEAVLLALFAQSYFPALIATPPDICSG